MSSDNNQALESALIDTVNMELNVIKSFCVAEFQCDVNSVIAVRMSRAIVSAICQINTNATVAQQDMFSDESKLFLNQTLTQIEQLNKQFELLIRQQPEHEDLWKIWSD